MEKVHSLINTLTTKQLLLKVANTTHDRKHADTLLEDYVTTVIPEILKVFFNSPFSEASTTIKVCV